MLGKTLSSCSYPVWDRYSFIETRGKNMVAIMPVTSYRIVYRKPNSGRQLLAHQLPKGDDRLAGVNSQQFMMLALPFTTAQISDVACCLHSSG
jgi:hypothetical protein